MSTQEVRKFYEQVGKSKLLKEEMAKIDAGLKGKQIQPADLANIAKEKIIPLANNNGYNFSESDLFSYFEEQLKVLDIADLDQISGGVSQRTAGIGLGAIMLLGLGGTAAMNLMKGQPDNGGTSISQSAPQDTQKSRAKEKRAEAYPGSKTNKANENRRNVRNAPGLGVEKAEKIERIRPKTATDRTLEGRPDLDAPVGRNISANRSAKQAKQPTQPNVQINPTSKSNNASPTGNSNPQGAPEQKAGKEEVLKDAPEKPIRREPSGKEFRKEKLGNLSGYKNELEKKFQDVNELLNNLLSSSSSIQRGLSSAVLGEEKLGSFAGAAENEYKKLQDEYENKLKKFLDDMNNILDSIEHVMENANDLSKETIIKNNLSIMTSYYSEIREILERVLEQLTRLSGSFDIIKNDEIKDSYNKAIEDNKAKLEKVKALEEEIRQQEEQQKQQVRREEGSSKYLGNGLGTSTISYQDSGGEKSEEQLSVKLDNENGSEFDNEGEGYLPEDLKEVEILFGKAYSEYSNLVNTIEAGNVVDISKVSSVKKLLIDAKSAIENTQEKVNDIYENDIAKKNIYSSYLKERSDIINFCLGEVESFEETITKQLNERLEEKTQAARQGGENTDNEPLIVEEYIDDNIHSEPLIEKYREYNYNDIDDNIHSEPLIEKYNDIDDTDSEPLSFEEYRDDGDETDKLSDSIEKSVGHANQLSGVDKDSDLYDDDSQTVSVSEQNNGNFNNNNNNDIYVPAEIAISYDGSSDSYDDVNKALDQACKKSWDLYEQAIDGYYGLADNIYDDKEVRLEDFDLVEKSLNNARDAIQRVLDNPYLTDDDVFTENLEDINNCLKKLERLKEANLNQQEPTANENELSTEKNSNEDEDNLPEALNEVEILFGKADSEYDSLAEAVDRGNAVDINKFSLVRQLLIDAKSAIERVWEPVDDIAENNIAENDTSKKRSSKKENTKEDIDSFFLRNRLGIIDDHLDNLESLEEAMRKILQSMINNLQISLEEKTQAARQGIEKAFNDFENNKDFSKFVVEATKLTGKQADTANALEVVLKDLKGPAEKFERDEKEGKYILADKEFQGVGAEELAKRYIAALDIMMEVKGGSYPQRHRGAIGKAVRMVDDLLKQYKIDNTLAKKFETIKNHYRIEASKALEEELKSISDDYKNLQRDYNDDSRDAGDIISYINIVNEYKQREKTAFANASFILNESNVSREHEKVRYDKDTGTGVYQEYKKNVFRKQGNFTGKAISYKSPLSYETVARDLIAKSMKEDDKEKVEAALKKLGAMQEELGEEGKALFERLRKMYTDKIAEGVNVADGEFLGHISEYRQLWQTLEDDERAAVDALTKKLNGAKKKLEELGKSATDFNEYLEGREELKKEVKGWLDTAKELLEGKLDVSNLYDAQLIIKGKPVMSFKQIDNLAFSNAVRDVAIKMLEDDNVTVENVKAINEWVINKNETTLGINTERITRLLDKYKENAIESLKKAAENSKVELEKLKDAVSQSGDFNNYWEERRNLSKSLKQARDKVEVFENTIKSKGHNEYVLTSGNGEETTVKGYSLEELYNADIAAVKAAMEKDGINRDNVAKAQDLMKGIKIAYNSILSQEDKVAYDELEKEFLKTFGINDVLRDKIDNEKLAPAEKISPEEKSPEEKQVTEKILLSKIKKIMPSAETVKNAAIGVAKGTAVVVGAAVSVAGLGVILKACMRSGTGELELPNDKDFKTAIDNVNGIINKDSELTREEKKAFSEVVNNFELSSDGNNVELNVDAFESLTNQCLANSGVAMDKEKFEEFIDNTNDYISGKDTIAVLDVSDAGRYDINDAAKDITVAAEGAGNDALALDEGEIKPKSGESLTLLDVLHLGGGNANVVKDRVEKLTRRGAIAPLFA